MPQSFVCLHCHIVFSTKHREQIIPDNVQPHIHAYIAGICNELKSQAFRVGGRSDHVHIACLLPRTLTLADLVKEIKQSSSKWIKDKDPVCKLFEWQSGYGVFSIGESQLSGLIRYIDNQEHHHRERSFQDELLTFLNKYGVEYDERYLWDCMGICGALTGLGNGDVDNEPRALPWADMSRPYRAREW